MKVTGTEPDGHGENQQSSPQSQQSTNDTPISNGRVALTTKLDREAG
jgi:hypothetical protein